MNRLPDPSARHLARACLQPLLDQVLAATVLIQNAHSGNIQLYDSVTDRLQIAAQQGFAAEFLECFNECDNETSICRRALLEGTPVVVEDIREALQFRADASVALSAGFRAVQATPMFARGGQPLGVISTHFRDVHRPSDHELRLTSAYARLAAELIERRLLDQALRQSEIRSRALVQKLPVGVYTCGAAGYLIDFNEAAAVLWGRRPELGHDRFCGSLRTFRPGGALVPRENSPLAHAMGGERNASGEEIIFERPDGARRNAMVYPEAIRDPSGAVIGGVATLIDITELKAVQEALRSSQDRFRRYFDLGLIGMATTSPTKGILEVNDELCRILGYERSELLQKTWAELTHPDDIAADVVQFNRVMAGEIDAYTLDKRWIRKDRRVIESLISATCMRRADGSVEYFVKLLLDISERKLVEEKLKRSEAYLAEGQRISHTGSWAIRLPSEEVFCSEEVYRIYGLDPNTTLSLEACFQLVHPDDCAFVEEAIRRAIREKAGYSIEHRAIRPDGSLRYQEVLGHPVFNKGGEMVEYVGTVADITERRRAEEALKKLQSEVTHAARVTMMGEFAAAIAHEVNQPLGAIANNASVALQLAGTGTPGGVKELQDVLSDVVSDANRASDIIARMRGLMARVAPSHEVLQMGDVIRDALALTDRKLTERRITVRLDIAEHLPDVLGDRIQLQQVILNLVMNAAEAMGEVPDARRVLTIAALTSERNARSMVLVTVHDLGCGFAPDNSDRLFEALYTTKAGGLGMGLRISHSIAEAHGGNLSAKANEDVGTSFFLTLPAR